MYSNFNTFRDLIKTKHLIDHQCNDVDVDLFADCFDK